tara:strand:- start:184 stop:1029 length:846 start_codon:yes stop_codon:yes gene_type:complete
METRIIQASYPGTGSTILANILNGIFCPDEQVHLERELKKTTDFFILPESNASVSSVLNKRYSIVAHATGSIRITANYNPEKGDLNISVFDDCGMTMRSGGHVNGNKRVELDCIENYTYHIHVTGDNPDAELNITTTKKGLPNLIIKSHFGPSNEGGEFDDWTENYPEYDLYFVVSEREKKYKECYYNHENILFIAYKELLETKENTVDKIVKYVYGQLKSFLPQEIFPDIGEKAAMDNATKRVRDMNELYEEIKHEPFEYCDKFYHIHGSHRGRAQADRN